jgi:hypothetical protein
MQLSRVALAAAFFVIGALIVIPVLLKSSPTSQAASATPVPTISASASPTRTAKHPPSHRPSHAPSRTASATPTRRPTPATPASPLKVTIGAVRCPGRTVQVSVTNTSSLTQDYAITSDGSISVADRIVAGATRKSTLNVKEDHATTISVTLHNVPVRTLDRHADCAHHTTAHTLPHTGTDSGLLLARIATGLAAMLTGVVIFWYGRLWPRRRDRMFDDAE